MAVSEQTPYIEYTANGTATSFALEFDCENQDHLIVLIDDVEPVMGAWSLSNGAVVFNTAPENGKKITLQRNTPFSRNTDYQSYNNSFRPPAVNKDFDWIWYKLQELGVADWILGNRIDALKNYVDDRDDELRAYLMEEIRKQGVALDQLDEYYNYLMQRLAQIAVDKGWDASFVVDVSGKSQQEINDQWIDATRYLKPDDPDHNVTQLRLLIEVAKSQGKGLRHAPTFEAIQLNDDIDFSGIRHIDFLAAINLQLEKTITWGGTAISGALSEIKFKAIVPPGGSITIPAKPMFRVNGAKQATIKLGSCNYFQIYADAASTANNSTAYNQIHFTGGFIRKLEITDSGVTNGWVNENHFYGGRVMQFVVTGKGYSHNHNLFFATSIEGSTSTITMTGVSDNHMQNIRMEGMPAGSVNFGADTFNNTIEKGWNGSGSIRNNFTNAYIGTNLGRGNIVVQKGSEHYDVTEIFSITPVGIVGNIYESASPNPYIGAVNESYPSVQLFTPKLNSVSFLGGRFLGLSDLIPVDLNTVFNFRAKYSGSLLRMYVQCFNAQRKLITEDIAAVSMYERSFVAATGFYINKVNLNAEQLSNGFAIESDQVKYVRVGVFAISAGEVESLSCQLITQKHGNNLQKPFVQNIRETAVINGGITQGYAKKGQKFYDTLYRKDNTCLFDMRVAATAGSSAGATSVNIGRAAEVLTGDVIGIQQNDGTTHWSKVVSVSGSSITIQNALTDVVSIGNSVVVNRWSILSGAKTYDFPSLAAGAVQPTTVSVLGAKIGQKVDVLFNQPLQGTVIYGELSSDGVVTVYHQNPTAAAVDVASGSLRVVVY